MSDNVYIYFDAEFSNFESPQLLSLGAVYFTLAEVYAEVDKITNDDCFDFVKQNVLTKFTGATFLLDIVSKKNRSVAWGFSVRYSLTVRFSG